MHLDGCPLNVAPLQSLSRAYTTVPPPAGQAAPNRKEKHADNTLVYAALGLVAAASAYYYFRDTDEARGLKDKAKAEGDHLKSKSAELADDIKQQGKSKWDQAKVCCISYQFKIDTHSATQTSGKEKLDSMEKEAETRGRGVVSDLETKYDAVKGSAKENVTRARDSTESLYKEARSVGEQKVANARDDAQKKVDKGKNGWSSWFNWGKTKADDIESEAERITAEK